MNFCSHCGSREIERVIPKGDSFFRYVCRNCHTVHYQNPKVIVGCLPIYQDKVLICRRAIEPQYGLWNLPAGYMENGETAEEGALRETYEEANARVKIIKLHTLYSLPHVNQVYLHFLAHLEKPEFSSSTESLEVKLFAEEEIPWDEIAFSSSKFSLKKYFTHRGTNFQGVHRGYFDNENEF